MEKKLLLQELADLLAAREGITKKKADAFTKCFFEVVEQGLENDKFVKIKGFGTFKIVSVSERESVNINTGERFQINGHSKITFTPDAELRDLINRPFAHFETVVINDSTDLAELEAVDSADEITNKEDLEDAGSLGAHEIGNTPDNSVPFANTPKTKESEDILVEENPTPSTYNEGKQEDAEKLTSNNPSPDEESALTDITKKEDQLFDTTTPTEEKEPTNDDTQTNETKKNREQASQPHTPAIVSPPPASTPEKFNWWKAISVFIIVFLLMVLSYFAGYFRLFCPCEFIEGWQARKTLIKEPSNPEVPISEKDTTIKLMEDTARHIQPDTNTTAPVAETNSIKNAEKAAQTKKQPASPTTVTESAHTNTVTQKQKTRHIEKDTIHPELSQVPGGKYRIVGTRQKYTVCNGETIRSIAEHVYGSKGYAPYIITHNHLLNPNNIATGSVLLLPELEKIE